MQVDISPKEFARYQNQLIELRNENYLATEARNKALKTVENLEVQLAKLSCELANTNANLTRIQNAGNITEIYKENDQLRHKLIGLESSFQLQSSTLRAEVTRLITEKEELLLKGLSPSDAFSRAQKQESQAIQFPSTSIQITNQMTQTDLSGNVVIHDEQEAVILRARLQELQSDLQAAHRDRELFSFRLEEANLELRSKEEHFSTKLIDYQQKQEEGQKELARLEQELAQAREIAESSRDAAESIRRRSENVKRDLKRQLANAIKNSGSLGPNRISRQNDDSESLCSLLSAGGAQRFSKLSAPECQSIHSCGSSDQELNGLPFGYRGKSDGPFPMNSERDKKSLIDSNVSNSIKEATRGLGQLAPSSIRSFDSDQILTNTLSEADFRSLLDRLSEVQEENCVFRRQIARLESELVEKRRTLQAILDGCLEVKPTSANSSHFQSSSSSSLLVSGTDDPIATSLPSSRTPYEITNNGPAIGSPSAAFRRLASVSKQLGPQIDAQNIQRLKQMCEELIARNLILEDLVRHFETRQSESTQHVTPHTGKLLI